MVNLHLQALSFLYMMLVIVVFYTKKNIKNLETTIYEALIWVNLLGIVLDIVLVFYGYFDPYHPMVYFLNKCYMSYIALWVALFGFYIFKVSLTNRQAIKYNRIVNIMYLVGTILEIVLIFMFDVKLYNENGVMYSYGGSITSAAFFAFLHVVAVLCIIIRNRKNLTIKKYIPIMVLVFLCFFAFLMRLLNPGLLLTTTIITFITVLMFFTIENPDVKMLEEFKLAKDRAEKANEEKELFLYNVTQDVRNPLYDIKKASNWLSENVKEIKDKDIKDGMYYINGRASSILEKVNNILDVTNMEITNIKVYNTKYDIRLLLKELNKSYTSKVTKGVKLKFNIDSNIPSYLDGDMLRLKQLLSIMLDNACKYTESGYIEVNLNTVVKREVCRLIITVEDTGCGIKATDIDEIFNKDNQMYASLDKIDDNKKNLAIAKSIATLLGGILMLESEIGSGTKVTLVLDQKIYNEKSESLEKLAGDSKKYIDVPKVMVVSEDEEYLESLVKKLSKYEIEIEALDLGEKCLNKIRLRHKYDLIIMDEELKKLNALEILNKLKDINGFDIDVAILTNNPDNKGYIKNGFKYIINRKITKKELDDLISGIE